MWKNSQRYLQHCLHFDFPVCVLLWVKKNKGKDFSIRPRRWQGDRPSLYNSLGGLHGDFSFTEYFLEILTLA
jgi:hypothetical protein